MIYLFHFTSPLAHAQHYLGCTSDLVRRWQEHIAGRSASGSPLIEAVRLAGIGVRPVRVWDGDFDLERELKRRKNGRSLCPLCDARAHEHGVYPLSPETIKINQALLTCTFADLPDAIEMLRRLKLAA